MSGALTTRTRRCRGLPDSACAAVAPPCSTPILPDQGGLVPVLYSLVPGAAESPTYVNIHLLTTQWIAQGVLLRFLFFDGFHYTFQETLNETPGIPSPLQSDVVTTQAIPPATVIRLNVTADSVSLQGMNSSVPLSTSGVGVNPDVIAPWAATLLCFAFVPTTAYLSDPTTVTYAPYWPLLGQPQFAIGFSTLDIGCDLTASPTAPNFPDQYSQYTNAWVFKYTVVYPRLIADATGSPDCAVVTGIKVAYDTEYPQLAVGSWSSLRGLISQPFTFVLKADPDISSSPSIWQPWVPFDPVTTAPSSTNVGPFLFCAMPGQMAVTYFRPVPKNTSTLNTPLPSYSPGEAAFLVTAPLPPNVSVYFTIHEYNSQYKGFGIADTHTGLFQIVEPSFTWVTPVTGIPAGTVVLFQGIGGNSSTITVVDARGVLPVGSVVNVNLEFVLSPCAVTSLTVLGLWQYSGVGVNVPVLNTNFVTAALTDQYGGDLPVLAPGVTLPLYVFTGPAIYSPGRIFNCDCLPGTVQAVMINNADFTQLDINAVLGTSDITTLAVFTGMCDYRF